MDVKPSGNGSVGIIGGGLCGMRAKKSSGDGFEAWFLTLDEGCLCLDRFVCRGGGIFGLTCLNMLANSAKTILFSAPKLLKGVASAGSHRR